MPMQTVCWVQNFCLFHLFYCSSIQTLPGYRVVQVQVVFSLPHAALTAVPRHRDVKLPKHLAYIELFTAFPPSPEPDHSMYKVSRSTDAGGWQLAVIVPVLDIIRSIHLY